MKGYFQFLKKQCLVPVAVAALSLLLCIGGSVVGSVIFRPLENPSHWKPLAS